MERGRTPIGYSRIMAPVSQQTVPLPWDQFILPIGLWVLTWTVVGAGFVLLVRSGRNYIEGWRETAAYFVAAVAGALWLFSGALQPAVDALRPSHALWLLAGALLQLGTHVVAHRHGSVPERRVREAPHVYWLRMDLRYTISKTFEILFQQTMLVALVRLLADAGLSTRAIVLVAVPVFGLVHIPIARLVGRFFGIYYIVSSLVAAVAMPAVILWRPDGFVLSYLLHVLYYVASQILFWEWGRARTPVETLPHAEKEGVR